jgi:hypothetical protein
VRELDDLILLKRVFRLSCEAGLGDCTADPPKDGSATILKAEARRTPSKKFFIKKFPISANSVVVRKNRRPPFDQAQDERLST